MNFGLFLTSSQRLARILFLTVYNDIMTVFRDIRRTLPDDRSSTNRLRTCEEASAICAADESISVLAEIT